MRVTITPENGCLLTLRNTLKRKLAAHFAQNVPFLLLNGSFLMKKEGLRASKTGSSLKKLGSA